MDSTHCMFTFTPYEAFPGRMTHIVAVKSFPDICLISVFHVNLCKHTHCHDLGSPTDLVVVHANFIMLHVHKASTKRDFAYAIYKHIKII